MFATFVRYFCTAFRCRQEGYYEPNHTEDRVAAFSYSRTGFRVLRIFSDEHHGGGAGGAGPSGLLYEHRDPPRRHPLGYRRGLCRRRPAVCTGICSPLKADQRAGRGHHSRGTSPGHPVQGAPTPPDRVFRISRHWDLLLRNCLVPAALLCFSRCVFGRLPAPHSAFSSY